MFEFLYRPETTGHLERLLSQAHRENCAACQEFFDNFKDNFQLNEAERRAVETTHRSVFQFWPSIAIPLQACAEINRWSSLHKRVFRQTSYDHGLTITPLAVFVAQGTPSLKVNDIAWMAQKAIIHDLGESIMGDVLKPVKEHRRLKYLYNTVEEDLSKWVLEKIPTIGNELYRIFAEEHTPRGQLFSAVENLDYIGYLYAEYIANSPHTDVIAIKLRNTLTRLRNLKVESPAIDLFLGERMDTMQRLMNAYPPESNTSAADSIEGEKITPRDLELMLNAAVYIFNDYAKANGGAIPDLINTKLLAFYKGFNP